MSNNDGPNLELIETDALAEELRSRFETAIIIGLAPGRQAGDNGDVYTYDKGYLTDRLGLLRAITIKLEAEWLQAKET